MSLNQHKIITGGISFRLNAWYAAIFLLSVVAFSTLLYLLFSIALERKENEVVEARLNEYAAIYRSDGVYGLRQSTSVESEKTYYVKLLSRNGRTLFLSVPNDWITFDPEKVQLGPFQAHRVWLRVPKDSEKDLVLLASEMLDGTILQVGRSTNNRETILQPFRKAFFIIVLPIVALGLLGGWVLANKAMNPVRNILATVQEIIQTGNLEKRVPVKMTGDELDELARTFNIMLEKNNKLINDMRESLDNVAHDLRTPLSRMRGVAEMALENPEDGSRARDALADCVEESEKVLTMLRTVMDVAEAESGAMQLNLEKSDLSKLGAEVAELYEYVAQEKQITITGHFDHPVFATIDKVRIRQVFANLLDNAIKYTPTGGTVELYTKLESEHPQFICQDSGMGITKTEQERVWDRLYRSDKSRSQPGLGLGLSLVRAIIQAHKGSATIESEENRGTRITITF
ncbi:MAG: two-component sensor histidine kinase [Verrucomicrobiales bacterium]|nr:two-component sensor histidine kinase [Verrucomicrobiales bacterium]